jgi:monoamine oxidase
MKTSYEFGIVGGGMAGLSAAHALKRKGIDSVLFEAHALGGRILGGENGVQLGAELAHGTKLLPVIHEHGLTAVPYDEESGAYTCSTQLKKGIEREGKNGLTIIQLIHKISSLIKNNARLQHISIQGFMDTYIPKMDTSLLKQMGDGKLEIIQNSIQAEYGAPIELMSANSLLEQSTFDGNNYRIKEGFSALPLRMAQGLNIYPHCPVHHIDWSTHPIQFHTSQGTFEVQKAIVTAPLGILQKGKILFTPSLPDRVQNAIEQLGNAMICKIIFTLQKRCWPSDMLVLRTDQPHAPILWPNETHPPSLTCYIGGKPSRELQKLPLEIATEKVVQELMEIFGMSFKNLITKVQRVAWNNMMWKRTGYSYKRGNQEARRILSEDIDGRMVFAGEAYIDSPEASTVTGALQSGEKAVHSLVKTAS